MSGEIAKILEQIVFSVTKVRQITESVATASVEQTQGIDQVNASVAQIDRIVQTNTANSEEAAAANEELSAQARELNHMVVTLQVLVTGRKAVAAQSVSLEA